MRAILLGGALSSVVAVLAALLRQLFDRAVWLDALVLHPARSLVLMASDRDILYEGANLTAWFYAATVGVFFVLGCFSVIVWLMRGHDESSSLRRTLAAVSIVELLATFYEAVV